VKVDGKAANLITNWNNIPYLARDRKLSYCRDQLEGDYIIWNCFNELILRQQDGGSCRSLKEKALRAKGGFVSFWP